MAETNKAAWRRKGDVAYVAIEARPPRKTMKSALSVESYIDLLPGGGDGAYEAVIALQRAILACKGSQRVSFWLWLRQSCDAWVRDAKPQTRAGA